MNAGAINPAAIPIPHVDPEGVRHCGKALKRDGAAVADTGHDIRAAWKGLAGQYEAPEAGRLFAAIDPVETAGEDFKQAATTAGDALIAFASAADYNLQRFRNLKASAVAFNTKIADDEDWREDADLADENDLLVRAVADTALRYREQEAICANKIAALVGGTQTTPINPNTANLDGIKTPWGDATGQDKPWYLDVGDAVVDFIGGSFTELGQLTGWMDDKGRLGRNGEFGFGAWWGNIRSSWGGVFEGIAGLVGLHDPKEGWGWHGLDSLGNNWKNLAHAFVPWTEWGERPGYVITTGLLNIGSIALGGYGIVKNLPKVGRGGHRADAGPPDPLDPDRLPNGPNGTPGLPTVADIQARLKQMIDGIGSDHGLERQFDKLDEKIDGLREHEPARDREPAMAGGRDHTPDIRDHHDPSDHGSGDRDPADPEHRPETSGEGRGAHEDSRGRNEPDPDQDGSGSGGSGSDGNNGEGAGDPSGDDWKYPGRKDDTAARGAIGDDLSEAAARARGDNVIARQVRVYDVDHVRGEPVKGQYTVIDQIIERRVTNPDGSTGIQREVVVTEVKTGNSPLTGNQERILPQLVEGGNRVGSGRIPTIAGRGVELRPGDISEVRVERWDIDTMAADLKSVFEKHKVSAILGGRAGAQAKQQLLNWMNDPNSLSVKILARAR